MIRLDKEFLASVGLADLDRETGVALLQHVYEVLEGRVGRVFIEQMTDGQLDEFDELIKQGDEAGALTWLETNFPRYPDVVGDHLERLQAEIAADASQILAMAKRPAGR